MSLGSDAHLKLVWVWMTHWACVRRAGLECVDMHLVLCEKLESKPVCTGLRALGNLGSGVAESYAVAVGQTRARLPSILLCFSRISDIRRILSFRFIRFQHLEKSSQALE